MFVTRLIGELMRPRRRSSRSPLQGPSRRGHALVVLDLRELEFCDSSGLSAILDLVQTVPAGRDSWSFRSEPIRRLLALSGLEDQLRYVYVYAVDVDL
jgi:anti-anti-sigma regulatory factor